MKKIIFFITFVLVLALNSYTYAATYVAEVGGTKYETLSGAISAAGTNSATITLLDNVNLDGKLSFPKDSNIVLDLNGKNLTVPTVENNYGIVVGGNLTIKGKGIVTLGMYGIGVQPSGNLTIENGTYKCLSGDYLLGCWGTATIKGGLFDGNYCVANAFDNGKINILDGTFYSKEPTIILGGVTVYGGAFNQNVEKFLAEGIEMKLYDGVYFTGKIYKITVEEAKHGTITVVSEAVAEQPVKVEAKASKGYELENIKVTDKDGKIIAVSNGEFVMPESDVKVLGIFVSETLDNTPQTGNGESLIYISVFGGILILLMTISFSKLNFIKKQTNKH